MKMQSTRIYRFNVLVIVAILVVRAGALYAAPTDWPSAVSKLNGWHGLKLVKGKRCPVCYSLVIPDTFGLKRKELQILIELPRKKVDDSMVYDLDGPLFADEDVLSHLLQLALVHSYATAGRVILNPEKYGMQLGLETSEKKVGTHVIPLIREYRDLNELIEEPEYGRLARSICHWSSGKYEFRTAAALTRSLAERGYNKFAETLSATCGAEKEIMRTHGEKFEAGLKGLGSKYSLLPLSLCLGWLGA